MMPDQRTPSIRNAEATDAPLLAGLNLQLIRDEGHRNAMSLEQLQDRMQSWLAGGYTALIAEQSDVVGYVLYCTEPDFVYVRQLFVVAAARRTGVGRRLIEAVIERTRREAMRLRIEVLVENRIALEFWKALEFADYCLTMERPMDVRSEQWP